MLGLVNILFLLERYPRTMNFTYLHSLNEQFHFPFVTKLLDVTGDVIKLTRKGKAFPLYNQWKDNSLLES